MWLTPSHTIPTFLCISWLQDKPSVFSVRFHACLFFTPGTCFFPPPLLAHSRKECCERLFGHPRSSKGGPPSSTGTWTRPRPAACPQSTRRPGRFFGGDLVRVLSHELSSRKEIETGMGILPFLKPPGRSHVGDGESCCFCFFLFVF